VIRRIGVVSLACALLGACAAGSGSTLKADDLEQVAEESSLLAREFETEVTGAGRTIRIAGLVQDAYRYAATISLDGRPLLQEVVIDDARYVRVLDRAAFPRAPAPLLGGWLVDRAGAPPEFGTERSPLSLLVFPPATQARMELLGGAPLFQEVTYFDDLPAVLHNGRDPSKWNPDAASYIPVDDRFQPHEEFGERFDALPDTFDPGSTFTSLASLSRFFQTSAVWVRDRAIARTETVFELPEPAQPRYRNVFDQVAQALPIAPPTEGALNEELEARAREVGRAILEDRLRIAELRLYRAPPAGARVRAPRNALEVDLAKLLQQLRSGSAVPGLPAGLGLPGAPAP